MEVIWPAVENAATYELVIKDKEGNLICTLIFNSNGQLTQIAFSAPSRHHANQAQTTGFSFIVTGLDCGTEYDLTMTAKDSNGIVIDEKEASFATKEDITEGLINSAMKDTSSKLIRNGQLFILRNGEIYNVQGARVE